MTEFPITDNDGLVQCTCEIDELFRLFTDASRRRTIALLENLENNWIRVGQMAQRLSMPRKDETATDWERDLHHIHLPMLEDTGLIDYDRQGKVVRYYHCETVGEILSVIDSDYSNT